MKVKLLTPGAGQLTLRLVDGDRFLTLRIGKRLRVVECDERTQPDQVVYYTNQLLSYLDKGGDVPSLMECLKLIASDCDSISEFFEAIEEIEAWV